MFSTIKLWASAKIIPISLIVCGVLLAAALGSFALYKLKDKDLAIVQGQYNTVVEEKEKIQKELDGINQQIADEKQRNEKLTKSVRQARKDYENIKIDLEVMKNDKLAKETIKSNPTPYEVKSKDATIDFMNRMNCITGNIESCKK